jgi:hypothetical protein
MALRILPQCSVLRKNGSGHRRSTVFPWVSREIRCYSMVSRTHLRKFSNILARIVTKPLNVCTAIHRGLEALGEALAGGAATRLHAPLGYAPQIYLRASQRSLPFPWSLWSSSISSTQYGLGAAVVMVDKDMLVEF